MKERKVVRQFAINTEIYDVELPQKIHEAVLKQHFKSIARNTCCTMLIKAGIGNWRKYQT